MMMLMLMFHAKCKQSANVYFIVNIKYFVKFKKACWKARLKPQKGKMSTVLSVIPFKMKVLAKNKLKKRKKGNDQDEVDDYGYL